jgi:tripartite-type tricarboxylate transporter receptor subunit TctC
MALQAAGINIAEADMKRGSLGQSRAWVTWLGAGLMALAFATHAQPSGYPTKPVVVQMAYPAGGPSDAAMRDFLPALRRELGQPVIVDNKPGASGAIAAMSVLGAPADGYTLLGILGSDLVVGPLTIASAKYKPQSFRPVALVGASNMVLISSNAYSFKNVDQLIDYARSNKKELSYGHWGSGSLPHIVGADFAARAGIKLMEIPYKGAASTIPDIGGGQLDLTFFPLSGALLGLMKEGRVKAIAIAAEKRSPLMPDVPTINEGRYLKDFSYEAWTALFAPSGAPEQALRRFNQAMNAYTASAEGREKNLAMGLSPLEPMSLEQTAAFYEARLARLSSVASVLKLDQR